MHNTLEKLGVILGFMVTLAWPVLVGAIVDGKEGMLFGVAVYVAFGVLFLALLLLGAVRCALSAGKSLINYKDT